MVVSVGSYQSKKKRTQRLESIRCYFCRRLLASPEYNVTEASCIDCATDSMPAFKVSAA